MNVEELQAQIVTLNETITSLNGDVDNYKKLIEENEKVVSEQKEQIDKLKEHSFNMFLKVQTPVEEKKQEEPKKVIPSLDEVIKDLM